MQKLQSELAEYEEEFSKLKNQVRCCSGVVFDTIGGSTWQNNPVSAIWCPWSWETDLFGVAHRHEKPCLK